MAGLGFAIDALKSGDKVARVAWRDDRYFLKYDGAYERFPCIWINYPPNFDRHTGMRFVWIPTQSDLLADDWVKI